jgi:hypothetical protein
MKKLQETIKYKGFDYTRVYENDQYYIYEQKLKGDNIGFEVFKKKINTLYNCESWPSDKAFGLWAWSTRKLEKAKYIANHDTQ